MLEGLQLTEQEPLRNYTTFRIGGPARYFVRISSLADLHEALQLSAREKLPMFMLGGGSNVLFADRGYHGIVAKMEMRGIELLDSDRRFVRVKVAAGERWDDFVRLAVRHGWHGVENMSLIPGTVGAAPVNNIGAYGQEVSAVVDEIHAWDTVRQQLVILAAHECEFSYRSSIFNCAANGRYVILYVVFCLTKHGQTVFTSEMRRRLRELRRRRLGVAGDVLSQLVFARIGYLPHYCRRQRLRAARRSVISLRTDGRLPDPRSTGSAGCFFKAAIVRQPEFDTFIRKLERSFDRSFAAAYLSRWHTRCSNGDVKVAVTPLIRRCGLADLRVGGAALHPVSPAVVINATGHATADDVMVLAKHVRVAVFKRTGLIVPIEPQLAGFTHDEMQHYLSVFD